MRRRLRGLDDSRHEEGGENKERNSTKHKFHGRRG